MSWRPFGLYLVWQKRCCFVNRHVRLLLLQVYSLRCRMLCAWGRWEGAYTTVLFWPYLLSFFSPGLGLIVWFSWNKTMVETISLSSSPKPVELFSRFILLEQGVWLAGLLDLFLDCRENSSRQFPSTFWAGLLLLVLLLSDLLKFTLRTVGPGPLHSKQSSILPFKPGTRPASNYFYKFFKNSLGTG